MQAEAPVAGPQGEAPPRFAKLAAKPLPQVEEYVTSAVLMLRIEATADASFAAILERSKFGMAMAAMIRIIITTIRSSMRENPFCGFFIVPYQTPKLSFQFQDTESSRQVIGSILWATPVMAGALPTDFAVITCKPRQAGASCTVS